MTAANKLDTQTLQYRKKVVKRMVDRLKICLRCEAVQTDPHLMKRHYKKYHRGQYYPPKGQSIFCAGCNRRLWSWTYRVHRCTGTLEQEKRKLTCSRCGEVFANPHLSVHLLECLQPTEDNIDEYRLDKHAYDGIRNLEQKELSSEEEDLEVQRGMNIRDKTLAAVKTNLMTCEPCGKKFTTTQAKRRHDNVAHQKITTIKGNPTWCSGCHKGFGGSSSYMRHQCPKTDDEDKEDACDTCGIMLMNPMLSIHRLNHYREDRRDE
ncbi:hypothetical protein GNI_188750 [Gregarina niphandrodes]|uniref:C2H2-type domain-containing protein n=1 Tax=Gregarina niphandrodes TaxID=110365 RepID=A0A023AWY2_GRENI|nr:hypothetical protein GNI_188750 [Gregarina niphandrodes]EZG43092.1 hypothetical protein GNI_188750 [Gregarina niphandrodes]|eukprot:XP_011134674.1 hypothetical protein GNI_188750 [Gregarina niphandrodes]